MVWRVQFASKQDAALELVNGTICLQLAAVHINEWNDLLTVLWSLNTYAIAVKDETTDFLDE